MEKLTTGFLFLLTFTAMAFFYNEKPHNRQNTIEEQYDGPYVLYKDNQVFIKYIIESNGVKSLKTDSIELKQKDDLSLKVITDVAGKLFQVRLKKELQNEKSEFPKVNRLLALSDIEGNFGALRKLLLAAKVIDEDLNWTFGEGNLVLTGDFFDRGSQVTELLWFIYYLEEKAAAAGGYVHFILGNHEIMNLNGDLRYLNEKYYDNATILGRQYITLYDENSELGRWLRTKNIIEKIGDLVFVHGGISANINRMKLSIPEINNLARPYYADTIFRYTDKRSKTIMGDLGPLWYRGYYDDKNAGIRVQIDKTLSQFGVTHIITGHTIMFDTISVWYNGKLLNTDVHHAAGESEALLIENDQYYRIDPEGKKVLLTEASNQKE